MEYRISTLLIDFFYKKDEVVANFGTFGAAAIRRFFLNETFIIGSYIKNFVGEASGEN